MVDPFGNYVVQYILELKQRERTHAVVQVLGGQNCTHAEREGNGS